jgi:hypothetical protein
VILSGCCTCAVNDHSVMNCSICSDVAIRCNPFIHMPALRPCATIWFLRHASLKMAGAISLGLLPYNHRSLQKSVELPSPTTIVVHALNRAASIAFVSSCMFDQGLLVHRARWHFNLHTLYRIVVISKRNQRYFTDLIGLV